ncbi:MAG: hypothetical protein ACC654_09630 [Acidimicrobiia bacterium]
MNRQSRNERARQKLATAKVPWATGVIGLAIVGIAFLISIVNASKETPNQFVAMTLQPSIFVGLGLLMYHIGQHLHALNQNVILMNSMDESVHDA